MEEQKMDQKVNRDYFMDKVRSGEEISTKLKERIFDMDLKTATAMESGDKILLSTLPDSYYASKGLKRTRKIYKKELKKDRKILAALDRDECFNLYETISRLSYKGEEDIYTSSSINGIEALMRNASYLTVFLSNEKNIKFLSSGKRLAYEYREAIFSQEYSCKIAFTIPKFVEMVLKNWNVLGEMLKHPVAMREFELSPVAYGILSHGNVRESEFLFVTCKEDGVLRTTSDLNIRPGRLASGPILVIGAYCAPTALLSLDDNSTVTTYRNYIDYTDHLVYPNGSVITNHPTIVFMMKELLNGIGSGRNHMIPIMKVCEGVTATEGIVLDYITLPGTI